MADLIVDSPAATGLLNLGSGTLVCIERSRPMQFQPPPATPDREVSDRPPARRHLPLFKCVYHGIAASSMSASSPCVCRMSVASLSQPTQLNSLQPTSFVGRNDSQACSPHGYPKSGLQTDSPPPSIAMGLRLQAAFRSKHAPGESVVHLRHMTVPSGCGL